MDDGGDKDGRPPRQAGVANAGRQVATQGGDGGSPHGWRLRRAAALTSRHRKAATTQRPVGTGTDGGTAGTTEAATRRAGGGGRRAKAGAAATAGGGACTAAGCTRRRVRGVDDGGATTSTHSDQLPRPPSRVHRRRVRHRRREGASDAGSALVEAEPVAQGVGGRRLDGRPCGVSNDGGAASARGDLHGRRRWRDDGGRLTTDGRRHRRARC